MQLPSIIRSFFPSLTSSNSIKKSLYEQTERIVNRAYLILLSLSTLGVISGVFLSLTSPLLGASICLISLAIFSCLLVLFPLLPDVARIIVQKRTPIPTPKHAPSNVLTKHFKSIKLDFKSH
ncbi:hypothetical protein FTM89_03315 [Chlamydia trachomatis]|uniref:Membrane protein n=2 Tax=Chlamydia muridarum TaxID=83560 RepID=A0A069ZU46_CHLMR|nr:hypothetical protein [Chlamydia muridarum]UFT44012.1 hypothetical protein FTN72_03330 [Chlamydia trachomatis]AAF39455.1 conserved hypothetical protein [Chlamydia muridarum str. Nigg]AHH23010.1 membrane protein [Chlamydia muridarum str. Nigg3 CMUT3-5]AHH23935.1 membrane protein [Chlamydia muridarum str. Nigg CM972]AID38142.1 membrane protein [Chlamydia muridarum str. Nigg 2 MCR]